MVFGHGGGDVLRIEGRTTSLTCDTRVDANLSASQDLAMRASLAVALVFLTATAVLAQDGPFRPVPVRSCPDADSLLGPPGDDAQVTVQGFYDMERNTSYFVAGNIGDPQNMSLRVSTKFAGMGPARGPGIQISVFLIGRDNRVVAELSKNGPVRTVFILNDSVTIYPRSTGPERFESGATTLTPSAGAVFEIADLLKVLAAAKAHVRVGPFAYQFGDILRREIRAMIRVAVCPPP